MSESSQLDNNKKQPQLKKSEEKNPDDEINEEILGKINPNLKKPDALKCVQQLRDLIINKLVNPEWYEKKECS